MDRNQAIQAVIETCPAATPVAKAAEASRPEPIRLGKEITIEPVEGAFHLYVKGEFQRPMTAMEEVLMNMMLIERKRAIEVGMKAAPEKVMALAKPEALLAF